MSSGRPTRPKEVLEAIMSLIGRFDRVNELAKQRGLAPARIALAWLLHKPVVTSPIVGATKTHHLEDAVAALSDHLSPEEAVQLEELYQPHAAPVGFA